MQGNRYYGTHSSRVPVLGCRQDAGGKALVLALGLPLNAVRHALGPGWPMHGGPVGSGTDIQSPWFWKKTREARHNSCLMLCPQTKAPIAPSHPLDKL